MVAAAWVVGVGRCLGVDVVEAFGAVDSVQKESYPKPEIEVRAFLGIEEQRVRWVVVVVAVAVLLLEERSS